jgi:biofilm PGA synthesis protein PgaD
MKYDSRIISKPQAQPPLHRTLWGVVTAACWAFYAYLLMPLLTLVLWLSGIRTARFELYQREHAVEPFLMMILPVLALACVVALVSWAEYNRWRFAGRKERRGTQADAGRLEIARGLGASASLAQSLAAGKSVILHMDGDARPQSLTEVSLASPNSRAGTDDVPFLALRQNA